MNKQLYLTYTLLYNANYAGFKYKDLEKSVKNMTSEINQKISEGYTIKDLSTVTINVTTVIYSYILEKPQSNIIGTTNEN